MNTHEKMQRSILALTAAIKSADESLGIIEGVCLEDVMWAAGAPPFYIDLIKEVLVTVADIPCDEIMGVNDACHHCGGPLTPNLLCEDDCDESRAYRRAH